jgi:gluconolactonase
MTKSILFLSGLVLVCLQSGCHRSCCLPDAGLIAEGATLQEISTEFKFTEGPAADEAGNVYFTDQPNDRIMVYTIDGRLETFMQPAGRANGLYFHPDGSLLACADQKSELWKINTKTKEHIVLASTYNGRRLNSTNDAWVRPDGGIYFTDPYYQRPWWDHQAPTQDGEHVYFLSSDYKKLIRVTEDLVQPNGLIGSPDGKHLYVSDIKDKKVYRYRIGRDGTLADKTLFCRTNSDGMTIDCSGNVYVTNEKGVTVFNPAGVQIEQIQVPQGWTANVTFGGPDRKTLFITASSGIYTLQMNLCGAP